jgi:hypothetical protein
VLSSKSRAKPGLAIANDRLHLPKAFSRRLSSRGNWCATDGIGLRAALLGGVAYPCGYGVRLDALIPDLPQDSPLALADEACGLASASADPEIVDDARRRRLITPPASLTWIRACAKRNGRSPPATRWPAADGCSSWGRTSASAGLTSSPR